MAGNFGEILKTMYTPEQIKKLKSIEKVTNNYQAWLANQLQHGRHLEELTFENFCNTALNENSELKQYIDGLSLN